LLIQPSSFIIHPLSRSRFLPIFFTLLAIAFVIVLYARLRRDMREPVNARATVAAPVTTSSTETMQPPAETMTLEPVKPKTKTTTTTTQDAAPTGAKPKPTKPPISPAPNASAPPHQSAVTRPSVPIAKGPTPSKPPPPTPASTNSGPQSSAQSQNNSQKQSEREAPKDPNSDTTPPQLIAIEFIPPQVHGIYSNEPAAIAAAGGTEQRRVHPWAVLDRPELEQVVSDGS